MLPFAVPESELTSEQYSHEERMAIMPVSTSNSQEIENLIFRIFVYAVSTASSDIHISGHGREKQEVLINIRTPAGLVNYRYEGTGEVRDFKAKMFKLTNTAQGGSSPDMLSTRFSMEFPIRWAAKHGLQPKPGSSSYDVEVRMEYVKTFDGYGLTCRLLDQQRAPSLEEFGMTYALESVLKRVISEPSGLILVSGPTGSGKTTLLNAILQHLNNGQNSILTIENPVEFKLRGDGPIKQIGVQGDVTFPRALRSGLRLDPDIILIGEIRDPETMEIALQAGQTGHLVLSTLHANSAADTITRMLELTQDKQRDAMRVKDVLKFVIATRLIDRYTGEVQDRALTRAEKSWGVDNGLLMPATVPETTSTVKKGKIPIIEAVEITYELGRLIQEEKVDKDKLYQEAAKQLQYETLAMAGMRAVEAGHAKLSECQVRLETNLSARLIPPLRSELAERYNMSYAEVSNAIDRYIVQREIDHDLTLAQVIQSIQESNYEV